MTDAKITDDKQKLLDKAKKARQKLEDAKKRAQAKKDAVEKAKQAVKEAEQAQKEAEKKLKKLSSEKDAIINLAGYKTESTTTRKAVGGFYLYKLLDKFDTDSDGKIVANGDFHKKLAGLPADIIGKALLSCSAYYAKRDMVSIYGDKFRAEIDRLLKKKEEDIKDAEILLDEEIKKSLVPADDAEEKKEEQEETK